MEPSETPRAGDSVRSDNPPCPPAVRLRLYVARSTPNSVRAEHNLVATLAALNDSTARVALELIDVFAEPKRAINDGVVVTPTLVGLALGKRIVLMGDLADRIQLEGVLQDLLG